MAIKNKAQMAARKTSKKNFVVVGTIKIHPRGFGFVTPENKRAFQQDIFIPKHLTQDAFDGDKVEVLVNDRRKKGKGPEGKILLILERKKKNIVGVVKSIIGRDRILAYIPALGRERPALVISSGKESLHVGDLLSLTVIKWGKKNQPITCGVKKKLGSIEDPSKDIPVARIEYGLPSKFSAKALKEAEACRVKPSDYRERLDLTAVECFTIDPETAKDFDDALSLKIDNRGYFQLGVHIADVGHFVKPGSALDKEAFKRGNSVYFPGFCLPMLPPELSENLCSLNPDSVKLTISLLIDYDQNATMIDYKIAPSLIKSRKRFTYREAKDLIDGRGKSPHTTTLKNMVRLARLLKKKRYARGGLEFPIPETKIIVDAKGRPLRSEYIAYDITHQMVEEFMLQANEIVARHLAERGSELTYRVHDEPSQESLDDFATLATSFGFRLPPKPKMKNIQTLFDEALLTPFGRILSIAFIRSQKLALYSPQNIGHFGLALTHYCHFTSPIRRYVDLIIHRILLGDELGYARLEEIADICSQKERIAMQAENSVIHLKTLRLLRDILYSDPAKQFPATITRVRDFGLFFEIDDPYFESFVPLSQLEDDYYFLNSKKSGLRGLRFGHEYLVGERVSVILEKVDLIERQISWHFTGKS